MNCVLAAPPRQNGLRLQFFFFFLFFSAGSWLIPWIWYCYTTRINIIAGLEMHYATKVPAAALFGLPEGATSLLFLVFHWREPPFVLHPTMASILQVPRLSILIPPVSPNFLAYS